MDDYIKCVCCKKPIYDYHMYNIWIIPEYPGKQIFAHLDGESEGRNCSSFLFRMKKEHEAGIVLNA